LLLLFGANIIWRLKVWTFWLFGFFDLRFGFDNFWLEFYF
jgi:hypothetical protein